MNLKDFDPDEAESARALGVYSETHSHVSISVAGFIESEVPDEEILERISIALRDFRDKVLVIGNLGYSNASVYLTNYTSRKFLQVELERP